MILFFERFILVVVAAICVALLTTNPWNLDRTQRVSLFVAFAAFALFLARTIENRKADQPSNIKATDDRINVPSPQLSNIPPSSEGKLEKPEVRGAPSQVASSSSDGDAPRVLAFSIETPSLDARASDATLVLVAHLVDDLSGVAGSGYRSSPTQVRFRSPSGKQFVDVIFSDSQRTEGTPQNGRYRSSASIARFSQPGLWTVEYFLLVDQTGNMSRLSPDDMKRLGFSTSFNLEGAGGTS